MVVIRLTRGGAKKSPFYHVVVADKRKPRDGSFIERVGYYDPTIKNADNKYGLNLDLIRINYWVANGAQPSERVKYLIKSFNLQQTQQPAVSSAVVTVTPPAASPSEATTETVSQEQSVEKE